MGEVSKPIPWTPEEEEYFREREDTRQNRRVMTTVVRRVNGESRYRMIYYRDGMASGGTWERNTEQQIITMLNRYCLPVPEQFKRYSIINVGGTITA